MSEKIQKRYDWVKQLGQSSGQNKTRRLTETHRMENSKIRIETFNYFNSLKHLFSLPPFICCFSALFSVIIFRGGSFKLDNFYCCLMISILSSIFAEIRNYNFSAQKSCPTQFISTVNCRLLLQISHDALHVTLSGTLFAH